MRFSREYKKEDTIIEVKNTKIGGKFFALAAGPCAVESEDQYFETARLVRESGANIIRGSVYKPRTSPYSFQGIGSEGLKIIRDLGEELGVTTETEVLDVRDIPKVAEHVDILRVGARNMQNFSLLKALARVDNPIILKRGLSATIKEWLLAAEYLMQQGKENIILCERGIRTFEPSTRNTLDLVAVPLLKHKTHLPVIVDPSHGTGRPELILPASKAAVAIGAHGLLIEVHRNPEEALSDKDQALTPNQFHELVQAINPLLAMEGKRVIG